MLPGMFVRKLQRCNRNIRILPSVNLFRPSGLYIVDGINYIHICGVDNYDVPERSVIDQVGHIIKRGWRATIDILIGKKLMKREVAERVFDTRFGRMHYKKSRTIGKKVVNLKEAISNESADYKKRHGGDEDALSMSSGMMGDFAHEIQKEEPVKKPNFEAIKHGRK